MSVVENDYSFINDGLRSPLWEALTARRLTRRQICVLVQKLRPPVQELIARHGLWPGKTRSPRKLVNGKFVAAVERNADLDTLGAVVLMLRLAYIEQQHDVAYQWGQYLWRMMVLLSPVLLGGGIAQALAELVEERIMPMASLEGIRYGFPPGNFMRVASDFKKARNRLMAPSVADPVRKNQHRFVTGECLLDRKSGWDYRYAFNPIRMANDDVSLLGLSELALREARSVQEDWWCHTWALNMLSHSRHPSEPPSSVRVGANLWGIDPEDPCQRWLAERVAHQSAYTLSHGWMNMLWADKHQAG